MNRLNDMFTVAFVAAQRWFTWPVVVTILVAGYAVYYVEGKGHERGRAEQVPVTVAVAVPVSAPEPIVRESPGQTVAAVDDAAGAASRPVGPAPAPDPAVAAMPIMTPVGIPVPMRTSAIDAPDAKKAKARARRREPAQAKAAEPPPRFWPFDH